MTHVGYVGLVAVGSQLGYFVVLAVVQGLAGRSFLPSVVDLFRVVWHVLIERRVLRPAQRPPRAARG